MIAAAGVLLAIFGYVYSQGRANNRLEERLDRNCRILGQVQADVRFLIVQHGKHLGDAQAFREIFQHAAIASCG